MSGKHARRQTRFGSITRTSVRSGYRHFAFSQLTVAAVESRGLWSRRVKCTISRLRLIPGSLFRPVLDNPPWLRYDPIQRNQR